MIALHFAHEINDVSKTLKTKTAQEKNIAASSVLVIEAAMRIISFMGLRRHTFANKQIGLGLANY